jgi:uncharacterized caspase-like protein
MKPAIFGLALASFFCISLRAQVDACNGAVSALNRVKEEITPDLGARNKAKDAYAAERIKTMLATMVDAAKSCEGQPELLYYRALLAREAGAKDTAYYERKLRESGYESDYDPFSVPPTALVQKDTGVISQKWALVVGINQFKDPGPAKLRFAAKDSSDFARYLTDPKGGRFQAGHVKSLTNGEATLAGVKEALGWLRLNVKPEDLAVVFFSSHGSERDADPNGVSYIILNDSDLSGPVKLYATSLQMIDLVQTLNREVKARRVVLFLDTCFSGDALLGSSSGSKRVGVPVLNSAAPSATAPVSSAFSAAFQNLKSGIGRAVITASRADESSWEDEEHQNGYFTHYLLEALQEGDGAHTLGQIFPKVRDKVLTNVSKDKKGQRQTPTSEFADQSDSIVISVPEAPKLTARGS